MNYNLVGIQKGLEYNLYKVNAPIPGNLRDSRVDDEQFEVYKIFVM